VVVDLAELTASLGIDFLASQEGQTHRTREGRTIAITSVPKSMTEED
jgi:hypothetical protein